MNRSDLQIVADARVADAEALFRASRWAGAYYLLGYAVECALKACIAKQFLEFEIPDKAIINDFYTHRLDKLLNISGAKDELANRSVNDPHFQVNWNTVRDWNEASRYDHTITEAKVKDLQVAVCDSNSGVLTWLKTLW